MAEYASRSSQDLNDFYSLPNVGHYSALTPSMSYIYGSGTHNYQPATTSYPTFSTSYLSTTGSSGVAPFYLAPSSMSGFSNQPGRAYTLPSQGRLLGSTYHQQSIPSRPQEVQLRSPLHDLLALETEDQDSPNEDTQLSEPIIPALEGYPNVKAFDELMVRYVKELSPKKQDKALIHAKRATNIRTVLLHKKTTSIESAQFRFWVKKMFTLMPNDSRASNCKRRICHENKPVAIREKLFKILTRAHKQCQHGGRDKTSAQVRKIYSWVPKELISRFVKLCPTCQVRRGSRVPSSSPSKSEPDYMDLDTSCANTPRASRRPSLSTNRHSYGLQSPMSSLTGFSSNFQSQNRWMTPVDLPSRSQDDTMRSNYHTTSHSDGTTRHISATAPPYDTGFTLNSHYPPSSAHFSPTSTYETNGLATSNGYINGTSQAHFQRPGAQNG